MLKKTALTCLAAGTAWGGFSAMDARWTEADKIQGQHISTTADPMEDDPEFNCLRHGNLTCGSFPGIRVQVDPSGHISIFNGTELIGWADLEGAVAD